MIPRGCPDAYTYSKISYVFGVIETFAILIHVRCGIYNHDVLKLNLGCTVVHNDTATWLENI